MSEPLITAPPEDTDDCAINGAIVYSVICVHGTEWKYETQYAKHGNQERCKETQDDANQDGEAPRFVAD